MKTTKVGEGKVYLIAGGNKIYTDIAARFVRSEKPVTEIIDSPYNAQIVKNILESGHGAALEFDYFLFGIEGYSRVCETQLVRKRLASYLIKSGRQELNGKRQFSMVAPEVVFTSFAKVKVPVHVELSQEFDNIPLENTTCYTDMTFNGKDIMEICEQWYEQVILNGMKEEDARYLKPQATEFKAIIGMNCHALLDWFKIRLCKNAQYEIRDLAQKMYALCKKTAPDLFSTAGPSCKVLGYCPEGRLQNEICKDKIPTFTDVKALIKKHWFSKEEK